jgi:hypothetical protein
MAPESRPGKPGLLTPRQTDPPGTQASGCAAQAWQDEDGSDRVRTDALPLIRRVLYLLSYGSSRQNGLRKAGSPLRKRCPEGAAGGKDWADRHCYTGTPWYGWPLFPRHMRSSREARICRRRDSRGEGCMSPKWYRSRPSVKVCMTERQAREWPRSKRASEAVRAGTSDRRGKRGSTTRAMHRQWFRHAG